MGIFDFFKKKENTDQKQTSNKDSYKIQSNNNETEMIKRLCDNARQPTDMLINAFSRQNETDLFPVVLYASGLAGIACHEAVKALGKPLITVEAKDGKKYFMGESLNWFLHESKYSVTYLICSITEMPKEKLVQILSRQIQTMGSDQFLINGNIDPKDLYIRIKKCWDGIFNNMTSVICKTPEEWPIFYGIVLQNIIKSSLTCVDKETIFNIVTEVACALSKMDSSSI